MIKVSIIGGGGHMGTNIIRRLETNGFHAEELVIYENDKSKLPGLQAEFPRCKIADTAVEAVTEGDIIILAVRPQNLDQLETDLQGCPIAEDKAVISIITAKTQEQVARALPGASVIRCSTNILLESGNGASFWMQGRKVPAYLLNTCVQIISSWGYQREVSSEREVNLAIVDSGCNPAILAYLLDAVIQAMIARGRCEREGTDLTLSIAENTIRRMREKKLRPSQVVAEVKTPGGITAAALEVFDSVSLSEIILEAFLAADNRVKELI